jgi:hypothetical protein
MDQALNIGFFVFHTSWIAFNCVGWIWRCTRLWHLATMALTALSWFGLGMCYGWGYCPCTDWHWHVRARLGYQDPPSYTQLLIAELTGIEPTRTYADAVTLAVFVVAATLSVALNAHDWRQRRQRRPFISPSQP